MTGTRCRETYLTLIAGLGNPGERHVRTLHNAGFWFVDVLAQAAGEAFRLEKRFDAAVCRVRLGRADVWLLKPQSYMNLSGAPVRAFLDYYRLSAEQLLVAHDEIDLPPGIARLKQGGGHGGHNGVRDVMHDCGGDFMRLRLGVGHPGEKDKVIGYVLKAGSAEVEAAVMSAIKEAADVVPLLADEGVEKAMNRLHTNLKRPER
ncbi:MAG TPA: aminoacyl-tRNA hydrolase [Woeseiaceae bacterium]|nr:aminoacyl-tRNA hydrolase [Woeseiaceae bacterium]